MRPAASYLFLMIFIFSNSNVLDAMMDQEKPENSRNIHHQLQPGNYVSMFIMNEGAFHGHLSPAPANIDDLPRVPHLFFVRSMDNRKFIAELQILRIPANEKLSESRYFIRIGNTCGFSDVFQNEPPPNGAHVMVKLHEHPNTQVHVTLFAGIDYHEGDVPLWTNETLNQERMADPQFIANTNRSPNRPRTGTRPPVRRIRIVFGRSNRDSTGAGPSNKPPR